MLCYVSVSVAGFMKYIFMNFKEKRLLAWLRGNENLKSKNGEPRTYGLKKITRNNIIKYIAMI